MFQVKRDQMVGIVTVILGIVVFAMIRDYPVPFTIEYPGPKAMPGLAAFGFVVCGLGIFLQSTFSKKEQKLFLVKEGWVRVGIVFLVLSAYVFLMKYLGFLIMTPIVCYVLSTLFSKGWKSATKGRILFSVLFTLFVYFLYTKAFSLPMPDPVWM
ncbi:MAG: tripartite tricarboxylate transporter TctB family protein [Sphaerochaetaceae bacterium]|nr:tripartite tricarboxylate transporter TctB family protein [Spirochaetaceae bacterium]MDY6344306.1 tripartite tricarboxylate transporter TctB family protein [Sphaerochaetaceae bacterium]